MGRVADLPYLRRAGLLGIVLAVSACAMTQDNRPPAKPTYLVTRMAGAPTADGTKTLTRARISTKSGEILILEPDGKITELDLDSAEGQDAFAVSEADLLALNANLDLTLEGVVAPGLPRRKTEQEKALEDFAARTQPALPTWKAGTEVAAEDFIGTKVSVLNPKGAGDLVEVTANLRKSVDPEVAFSYATCALAGWAKENGAQYGRHIRTLQDKRNGKLLVGAAFTVTDKQPMGLRVMETEQTLRECKTRGIPTA